MGMRRRSRKGASEALGNMGERTEIAPPVDGEEEYLYHTFYPLRRL